MKRRHFIAGGVGTLVPLVLGYRYVLNDDKIDTTEFEAFKKYFTKATGYPSMTQYQSTYAFKYFTGYTGAVHSDRKVGHTLLICVIAMWEAIEKGRIALVVVENYPTMSFLWRVFNEMNTEPAKLLKTNVNKFEYENGGAILMINRNNIDNALRGMSIDSVLIDGDIIADEYWFPTLLRTRSVLACNTQIIRSKEP